MKKIRNNVFETNSSSTHALTIGKALGKDYVPYGKNLKINWFNEENTLTTLQEKVSYLVSHIASWYVYNAEDYEDLIEQVKDNWDFKRIERYVKENFDKDIVFPRYDGDIEDMIEINHQLISWNHSIDEVIEDMLTEERDYLGEVLQDGKDIQFGRD
ncbi:MAG: hypothetical protein IKC22_01660 [Bacilli bacterium]|nr:hypothetical protein [bacterium]MBR2891067.1 hypothetical protein [Bacilli bacterium]